MGRPAGVDDRGPHHGRRAGPGGVHDPRHVGAHGLALPRQAVHEGGAAGGRDPDRRLGRRHLRGRRARVRRRHRLPGDPQAAHRRGRARHRAGRRRGQARRGAGPLRRSGRGVDRRRGVRRGARGLLRHRLHRRARRAGLRVALLPQRAGGDAHALDLPAVRLHQPDRLRGRLPGAARAGRPGQRRAGHRHQRHAHGVVLRPEGAAVLRDRLQATRRRRVGPLLGGQRHRPLPRLGGGDRARAHRCAALAAVRHRDRRAAARPRRPHQRLLRRRRGAGPRSASG